MNAFTSARPVFSHVGIYVRDIAKMEDFYRRVMGFIVTDRGEPVAELRPVSRGTSTAEALARLAAQAR